MVMGGSSARRAHYGQLWVAAGLKGSLWTAMGCSGACSGAKRAHYGPLQVV